MCLQVELDELKKKTTYMDSQGKMCPLLLSVKLVVSSKELIFLNKIHTNIGLHYICFLYIFSLLIVLL
jgi:hypothetical protein